VGAVRLFADETGNFDFSRRPGASRYFGVGTLQVESSGMAALQSDLTALRFKLQGDGQHDGRCFHATEDKQAVRNEVFAVLADHDFRFDATMLEKSKSMPHLRADEPTFFKYAWFCHFRFQAARLRRDELAVFTADLNTRKQRSSFQAAVTDVVKQCIPGQSHHVAFWKSETEPCLQASDYCLWAVSRKYERGDMRSYELIRSKVSSDFDLFRSGSTHHY
jgi:hypothetical protein